MDSSKIIDISNKKEIKNQKKKVDIKKLLKKGLNSSISTTVVTLFIFPLENIKTRFQLQSKDTDEFFITRLNILLKKIYNKEGLNGFYVGLKPYLIYNIISNAIFMIFKEFFNSYLKENKFNDLKSSYLAGIINVFISTPFSVLSNFLIHNNKKNMNISIFQAIRMIVNKKGIKGLYSGFLISLVLVINPTINFSIFSLLKKILKNHKNQDSANFISGIFSKFIATLITYPYQTIKVHQQGKSNKKMNLMRTIMLIIMNKGLKGFYDGIFIKLTETAIKNGLYLMMYEKLNKKNN